MGTMTKEKQWSGYRIAVLVVLGFGLALASCGGSDSSWAPPTPVAPSPAGLWMGSFTSTTDGGFHQSIGLISENRDAQFLVAAISGRHMSGQLTTDGDWLTGTLNVFLGREGPFFGFGGVQSILLDGTVEDKNGLFGNYSGDEDAGRFNLNYISLYEDESSLSRVAGVWVFSEAAAGGALYTVTLDIDGNGNIFGTDTGGCVYSGGISLIDARFNGYQVTFNVTECLRKNGDYSGLSWMSSIDGGQDNLLTLTLSNSSRAFAATMQKF